MADDPNLFSFADTAKPFFVGSESEVLKKIMRRCNIVEQQCAYSSSLDFMIKDFLGGKALWFWDERYG